MRSMSDRRDRDLNEANFKDTTALRTKSKRASPQQIFQKTNGTIYHRPLHPPPKLPDISHNQIAPLRPPRQQSNKVKRNLSN